MSVIERKHVRTVRLKIEPAPGYTTQDILHMLTYGQAFYDGSYIGDFILRVIDGKLSEEQIAKVVGMVGMDTGEVFKLRPGDELECKDLTEAFRKLPGNPWLSGMWCRGEPAADAS